MFGCCCSGGNVEPQSFEEKPKEAPEVPPVAQTEQLEVVKMDEPKEAPTPLPFFVGVQCDAFGALNVCHETGDLRGVDMWCFK